MDGDEAKLKSRVLELCEILGTRWRNGYLDDFTTMKHLAELGEILTILYPGECDPDEEERFMKAFNIPRPGDDPEKVRAWFTQPASHNIAS